MNYYKAKFKRKCKDIALDRSLVAMVIDRYMTGVGI